MDVIEEHLTPAGSKIVRVIAADKILADFARILSLLKGANSSNDIFPSGEILPIPSVHIPRFAKIPIGYNILPRIHLNIFCQLSYFSFCQESK